MCEPLAHAPEALAAVTVRVKVWDRVRIRVSLWPTVAPEATSGCPSCLVIRESGRRPSEAYLYS